MPDLTHRSTDTEWMDDLNCSGAIVHQTLHELDVINKWLGGNQVTIDGLDHLLKKQPEGTVTIVDLGCGSGRMLQLIDRWNKRKRYSLKLTGVDANPHIVDYAVAHVTNIPSVTFKTLDIFSDEFKRQQFDIVLATLFLHHFTDDQLVDLFRQLQRQATRGIIVNDIHRHWFAYHSIRLLTRLFSQSPMVQFDAPLSVQRAFRKAEIRNILSRAGIARYRLRWRWAFRWQLIIPG